MPDLHLILGNRNYSSWSMRPALLVDAYDLPVGMTVLPLGDEAAGDLAARTPAGLVPVLETPDGPVWESLAIVETLAERFPNATLWPSDPAKRQWARSAAAEMHAGFAALRATCPMNLGLRLAPLALTQPVRRDVERISRLLREGLDRAGGDGFLCGAWGAVDAFYTPVATRFRTYGIAAPPDIAAYFERLLAHPAFLAWEAAALEEPWRIAAGEGRGTVLEDRRVARPTERQAS